MSFSSGTFSINSTGQPVVTGTVISSTAFNALTADIATGLSTCMLKDGTQTVTANIPMANFKFTGLGAGSATGDSLRYGQVNGVVTTAGDMLYATGAGAFARLGIGAAGAISMVNAGATAPSWLAIGTARQQLAVNSGATAVEYVASLQSLMTGTGDIVQSSGANTPARLAIGTAGQALTVNSGATAAAWGSSLVLNTAVATTSGTAVTISNAIPTWVNRLTLNISGVSTNGTAPVKVQVGTGGSATTSGYVGSASIVLSGNAFTVTNPSDGFHIAADSASTYTRYGTLVLTRLTGNTWTGVGTGGQEDSGRFWSCGGEIALAGALDFMRITADGVDTFDLGSVSLMWE